ncbi:MAG: hypothetical protein K8L99_27835 [Anaerolineae bacterium]|nr:hypothetical protein [Anaerolineae bacterium]
MEKPLTILYTANIRGELELLPRLHTFLRQLRSQPLVNEDDVTLCALQPPPPRRFLLLDLGASCDTSAWHCAVTGGRSALIVLDAMGYQAANVSGFLTEEGRSRLDANLMNMALVDEHTPWSDHEMWITAQATSHPTDKLLHIHLTPADRTRLEGRTLQLASVEQGQVGIAHIDSADGNGKLALSGHGWQPLPPRTAPDPTIAATVDFVLSEARLFQRRQS